MKHVEVLFKRKIIKERENENLFQIILKEKKKEFLLQFCSFERCRCVLIATQGWNSFARTRPNLPRLSA